MPPNLVTPEVIPVLPAEYQVSASNEYFVIVDCGVGDQERIFIFALETRIPFLAESEDCYADGTIKVCPKICLQLYTVHAQK